MKRGEGRNKGTKLCSVQVQSKTLHKEGKNYVLQTYTNKMEKSKRK